MTALSADLFAPPAPCRNHPGPISTAIRLPAQPGTGEPPELDAYLWLPTDALDEQCADYMAKRIRMPERARTEGTFFDLLRGELIEPEGQH